MRFRLFNLGYYRNNKLAMAYCLPDMHEPVLEKDIQRSFIRYLTSRSTNHAEHANIYLNRNKLEAAFTWLTTDVVSVDPDVVSVDRSFYECYYFSERLDVFNLPEYVSMARMMRQRGLLNSQFEEYVPIAWHEIETTISAAEQQYAYALEHP